jgi:hypothetical protein
MAAATVCVSVTEKNIMDDEGLPKNSCCKKCLDLEKHLQETLQELSSAHLIIELIRNEVTTETESAGKQSVSDSDSDSAKKKNICCDPTRKAHIKTKWLDVMASRSPDRKKEEYTSKRISESNITSPSTEEEWKTVNSGHKKPPIVNHAMYCQIPVIINQYAQLRDSKKDEQVAHGPVKTHELETRKEDRENIWKRANNQKEKKHKIIVNGDSHARGCAAEIKSNLDENFDVQGYTNPGAGLSAIITSANRGIQQLSKQVVVLVWGGSKDVGKN